MNQKKPIPNCPKCFELMQKSNVSSKGFFCGVCGLEILEGFSGFQIFIWNGKNQAWDETTSPCKTLEELFRTFQLSSFQ